MSEAPAAKRVAVATAADSKPASTETASAAAAAAAAGAGASAAKTHAHGSAAWQHMMAELHRLLSCDCADVDEVKAVLQRYQSEEDDWAKFALFDDHRYTRNLVDDGNGKFNIMLLCWNFGQASTIHSHSGSHCFMKILDGTLVEQQFPPPGQVEEGAPLPIRAQGFAKTDQVLYINDQLATHRVINPNHSQRAVSMHVYCPPYEECKCYDERSGIARSSGKITFFSKRGELCSDKWDSGVSAVGCQALPDYE